MSRRWSVLAAVLLATLIVAAALPASAHLHERVGDIEFTVGWASEPAFAGEPNTIQVFVTEALPAEGEEEGPPVDSRQVKLTVEVIFGDKDATTKMAAVPLEPFAFGSPGEFRVETFVPSRPGTWTFHFKGTIKGEAFDKFYTSGSKGAIEGTEYSDVKEVAAVSFPEKDQTNADLARALDQTRKTAATAAQAAKDDAKNARLFGIIGIALGAIGVALGLRSRGKKAAS
ncbi:MAG: hypothetical protein WEB06_12050 [Actinomycetota bacterium]